MRGSDRWADEERQTSRQADERKEADSLQVRPKLKENTSRETHRENERHMTSRQTDRQN